MRPTQRSIVMAPQSVAGDLYYDLDGQLSEIKRQMRQVNGYPFDPTQLKAHLQAAIEGRFGLVSGTFKRDMHKDGWTLLENVPRRLSSVIEEVPFLRRSETYINGEEMVRRARTKELDANYGQEDAEWLLDNQDKIPVALRKFYLVFPETVWQALFGRRGVPYLSWYGGQWLLSFGWLGYGFNSYARLVRPRK